MNAKLGRPVIVTIVVILLFLSSSGVILASDGNTLQLLWDSLAEEDCAEKRLIRWEYSGIPIQQERREKMLKQIGGRMQIMQGDITKVEVDAIVNAANSSLLGGGGVDGAIHRAGGPQILEECKEIRKKQGECPTGEAVITTAGKLRAKYVIHTVGPVWRGGEKDEPRLLTNCYRNSLALAVENAVTTIAFPNISTGVYRFPRTLAAEIALQTVAAFLKDEEQIKKVIFVCFDRENYELYQRKIEEFANTR